MLKIRLARYGKKKLPQYKIVVIDARKSRDGKFIENLGIYQPIHTNKISININKLNWWLKRGCKITKTVKNLIKIIK